MRLHLVEPDCYIDWKLTPGAALIGMVAVSIALYAALFRLATMF